jgi:integrase
MPVELQEPRQGKTKYWYARGTLNGKRFERSTKALSRKDAQAVLDSWIERGELSPAGDGDVKTFSQAALDYINHHKDEPRIAKLDSYFGDTPISEIDNDAIRAAAVALFPKGTAQTRNRELYTPLSAILKFAGCEFKVKRPKGWRGEQKTDWLHPEEAFRIFDAAETIDVEFSIFLIVLNYTGVRLSEGTTGFPIDRLKFFDNKDGKRVGHCYVQKTKTGTPRGVHLPPFVATALQRHPRGLDRPGETVFRFRKNGRLYELLDLVSQKARRPFAPRQAFHLFRHTYGAWGRRYGGLDTTGLIATGTWKDESSVRRYEHAIASEEAQKADLMPVPKKA